MDLELLAAVQRLGGNEGAKLRYSVGNPQAER